jgi:hypothetical protein
MFGISQSQAAGLTISSGLTPIFWVYCVFVISLLVSCAWMLTAPQYRAMPAGPLHPAPGDVPPAQSAATGVAADSGAGAGDSGAEAADSGAVARDSGAEARDSGAGTGDNKASDAGDSNGGEDHEESTYA